jgi:hypothetical protein
VNKLPRIGTVDIEGQPYFCGFKVVTLENASLGLRRNPDILVYPLKEWFFLPEEKVAEGPKDPGGIWLARTLSGARALKKYMLQKHQTETRIFHSAVDEILYCNSYRLKTNGILLIEEV